MTEQPDQVGQALGTVHVIIHHHNPQNSIRVWRFGRTHGVRRIGGLVGSDWETDDKLAPAPPPFATGLDRSAMHFDQSANESQTDPQPAL